MIHANLKSILASGSREEDFLNYLLYTCIKTYTKLGGVIYDPRKFICTNLSLLVRMLFHTKYQCIRASGL